MDVLLKGGTFFEGPRWHDGRWWVSDFGRRAVYSVGPAGDERIELAFEDDEPSGLGWMPDGSLLAVQQERRRVLRRKPSGEVVIHADLSHLAPARLNDMVVDACGRAYVGNFGSDISAGEPPRATPLILVDTDGSAREVGTPLWFPNGAVITPDGRLLIVGETLGSRYTAFPIAQDGRLLTGRSWAEFGTVPGAGDGAAPMLPLERMPEGCCLDEEQCLWFADLCSGRLVRSAEGGRVIDEKRLPDGLFPIACMLGGEDGHTLLVCAAAGVDPHAVSAGEAVLLTVGVSAGRAGLP